MKQIQAFKTSLRNFHAGAFENIICNEIEYLDLDIKLIQK